VRHSELSGDPLQQPRDCSDLAVALDYRGNRRRIPSRVHVPGSASRAPCGESWLPRIRSPRV
jgi:hypothetical protein